VSHPIQYYVPLYRKLAKREELEVRIFFTWHAGERAMRDRGFEIPIAWDIPLTEGYDFELVQNVSADPGTHRFSGLRNPSLAARLSAWKPDVLHVTGWAWRSHLETLIEARRRGLPSLFRGDSHLLDSPRSGPRWWAKWVWLRWVYSLPTAFLFVGQANRSYYRAFGVAEPRLRYCPHSIDVARFAEPAERLEREAAEWRRELGIPENSKVLLFAGKFERKKQPTMLMRALLDETKQQFVLVLAGAGELGDEVHELAAAFPSRFRVLPFQNQSRMPVVYRLGDIFVLPSAFGESWGLAANEALACSRPVLLSDRVGCAADVVDPSCGEVFAWESGRAMVEAAQRMTGDAVRLMALSHAAGRKAWAFDVSRTEDATVEAACAVGGRR